MALYFIEEINCVVSLSLDFEMRVKYVFLQLETKFETRLKGTSMTSEKVSVFKMHKLYKLAQFYLLCSFEVVQKSLYRA